VRERNLWKGEGRKETGKRNELQGYLVVVQTGDSQVWRHSVRLIKLYGGDICRVMLQIHTGEPLFNSIYGTIYAVLFPIPISSTLEERRKYERGKKGGRKVKEREKKGEKD